MTEFDASASTSSLERTAAAARPISYYDGCVGYDPAFLGVPIALPELTDEQRRNAAVSATAKPGEDATVLPYTHFSVVINRGRQHRQLAYYTAVNIDGGQVVDIKRTADRWFFDPRIAQSEQIGEELYQRNALDRGHLVRRLDPVWGSDSTRANDDTFHFTNCSPQHERFNQGKDLWQGLENYILPNADILHRKITVFTGPVTDDSDPIYKGVRLPVAFWKIIAYCRSDGGTYRLTIAQLDARTGLNFEYLAANELPLSSLGVERGVDYVRVEDDYSNLAL